MKAAEVLGLVLIIAAVAVTPLAYWTRGEWMIVAFVAGGCGALLFFTKKNRTKYEDSDPSSIGVPPGEGQLRGIHRSAGFDDALDD